MKNLPYIKIRKETEGLIWMIYRNFLLFFVSSSEAALFSSAAQCSSEWKYLHFVIDYIHNPSQKTPEHLCQLPGVCVNPFFFLLNLTWDTSFILSRADYSLFRTQFVTPHTISRDWFPINLGFSPFTRQFSGRFLGAQPEWDSGRCPWVYCL